MGRIPDEPIFSLIPAEVGKRKATALIVALGPHNFPHDDKGVGSARSSRTLKPAKLCWTRGPMRLRQDLVGDWKISSVSLGPSRFLKDAEGLEPAVTVGSRLSSG